MPLWESTPFWGIAGLVGGFLVAALFFLMGKSRKVLEYEINSTCLISKEMAEVPGLKILFEDKPIQNLTSTTVKFINSGNETIDYADFATRAPLCIKNSVPLLDSSHGYRIGASNQNSAPFVKKLDETSIQIGFEYLKPKESFTVIFLHDGDLSVLGELKSGRIRKYHNRNIRLSLLFIVLMSVSLFTTATGLSPYFSSFDFLSRLTISVSLAVALLGTLDFVLLHFSLKNNDK